MAYQLGVLGIIVLGSACLISIVIIAIMRLDFGLIGGMIVAFGLFYWFSGLRTPEGFWNRVYLLFRDGVPLAPYGFRNNATLGYWLGIPMIYVGHVIMAGTLYVGFQLLGRSGEGVPLGIGVGFGLMAWFSGIGLVESSYRLWAKRLDGVLPGDAGSSPARPVVYSIAALTLVFVGLYSPARVPETGGSSQSVAGQPPATGEEAQAPAARIAPTDFLAVTYPGWTGEARSRQDAATVVWSASATMSGSISSGNAVDLRVEAEGAVTELQLRISDSGEELNGLRVTERSEIPGGMLRIVAYGDAESSSREHPVRLVVVVSDEKFMLRHYIEEQAGKFVLRDEYSFQRTASDD